MKTYVALLRGINVGGNHKVEMSGLKKVFESAGFSNVVTYINSGNVIFSEKGDDAPRATVLLAQNLEKILEKKYGFSIKTIVLAADEIKKVSDAIPTAWKNDDTLKTDVLFLFEDFDRKESLDLIKKTPKIDFMKYIPHAIVWNIERKNAGKSGMKKCIGTLVYKNMTARNVNTVRKLAELADR